MGRSEGYGLVVVLLLCFATCLLVAVLVSDLAHRTVLSTAVLFLAAGLLLGQGALDVIDLGPDADAVSALAELALFTILFTDGMRVGVGDLKEAWRLPGRALLLGLPLTLLGNAVLAVVLVGLPWVSALLVGAVLSPTDPVLAHAIVGRDEAPAGLRHLLNVESGLNDGLALPFVLILVEVAGDQPLTWGSIATELSMGVGLGVAVPWTVVRLLRTRAFATSERYSPLAPLAIGLLVFSLGSLTHANLFLAAFAGGITLATMAPELRDAFGQLGEVLSEVLKLAALLLFGVLVSPDLIAGLGVSGLAFGLLVLVLVRPLALGVALAGSSFDRRQFAAAAWFGPKGFATVVYALLVLDRGIPDASEIFHLAGFVVVVSVVLHSSTDVLVTRWLATGPEPTRPR